MNYDTFAKFYDSVMGDRVGEAARIEETIKQYNPAAKNLLDLGCGTGTFLKYFFDHGFQVEGIDLSEEMLSIAHQKLPGVQLSRQDMASFSLPHKFDVVTCLFDSINHLVEYADWEGVFSRVHLHLNKGGLFIFDINTFYKLEMIVKNKPFIKEFDDKKVTMTVTPDHGVYNWNVKIMEGGNMWSENIKEQSFPIQQVLDSLKRIFREVSVFDQSDSEASENSQRVYFVCVC